MDRVLRGFVRRYLFQIIGKGVDMGAEHVARRRNGGEAPDLTPAQRAQAQRNSANVKKAMRLARRIGRF